MLIIRRTHFILSMLCLLLLLLAPRAMADSPAAQDTLSGLVEKFNRAEIGKIELFWMDLGILTQVGIEPDHFARMRANPDLLRDHTIGNDKSHLTIPASFHKIYVDAANTVLRTSIENAVKSLGIMPLSPASTGDMRLSITFYDRHDSEIATLYYAYDGASGAVNFNNVRYKGTALFDLVKQHYVDPQEELSNSQFAAEKERRSKLKED